MSAQAEREREALANRSALQEVHPGVFLTSRFGARRKDDMKAAGITHVVIVATRAEGIAPCFPDDFRYMQVEINDNPSSQLVCHLKSVFEFMQAAVDTGGKVLVHCSAGRSRSASFVIAFKMRMEGVSFQDAFRAVDRVRVLSLNGGFIEQLESFEQSK
mmetsp:Transcript_7611/g.19212  ORF Transcript_7611/g.19212 Transcript_7611/m.19212 type:complete len:159 (-) Transcript_7611:121-597(-)